MEQSKQNIFECGGGPTTQGVGETSVEKLSHCTVVDGIVPHFNYMDPIEVEAAMVHNLPDRCIPLNGLSHEPYEFIIDTMADYFTDLASLFMYVRYKIVDEAGNDLTAEDGQLNIVDNLLNALWDKVSVKVNDVVTHPESARLQAYRAQMEYLLSIEKGINTCYGVAGFGMSDSDRKNDLKGKQKGEMDLCGPIALDILRTKNFLAPGHKLSLTFYKAEDKFLLIHPTPTKYKIVITDIFLEVNRIRLMPEVMREIISRGPQNYKMSHTELRDFPLTAGISSWNIKVHAGGVLPHQVVVGMVDTAAMTGNYQRDPLKFENNDLNHICLRVNGVRSPQDPLTPDFAKNRYSRIFLHVYQNTGKMRQNGGNYITKETFKTKHCLIPFDLTPDKCNNRHLHAGLNGSLDVELAWANPLSKNITVVILSVFNQVLQLEESGAPPVLAVF